MKITGAATHVIDGIYTVPSTNIKRITHYMRIPASICPFSHNPIQGIAIIAYTPSEKSLEVVSLKKWFKHILTPMQKHPRSMEGLAAYMKDSLTHAAGVETHIDLILLIYPFQFIHIKA